MCGTRWTDCASYVRIEKERIERLPLVRALAVDVLEEVGFDVLEAPTADYALVVLERREEICVLLTDVDMPGRLNGFQLARIVQDRFTACGSSLSRERLGPVRLTLLRARYSSQSRTS